MANAMGWNVFELLIVKIAGRFIGLIFVVVNKKTQKPVTCNIWRVKKSP